MICPRHLLRRDELGRCTGCIVADRPRHVMLRDPQPAPVVAVFDWATDPEMGEDLTPPHGITRVG